MHTYQRALGGLILPIVFLLALLAPAAAVAQVPTGTITGRVVDAQDRTMPGVTVTVTSPALQGVQSTTTTVNGDYVFRFLPPGVYTIVFELSGFAPLTETRTVAATETVNLQVTLQAAGVAEEVTVTADSGVFTNSVQVATNFNQSLLDALPTARTLLSAVSLAPAVHATGPDGEFSIAGAVSYENLYMINGVQVQDNIRGTLQNLYIEDALQETTIATSGVSAEYGRFTGGVVNAITKSGGNAFSGSFRTSFRNDDWRTVSPFGESKVDQLVPTYEFTLGGPIARDRTWFFVAGRLENADTSRETIFTNIPYKFSQDEQRLEFKVTQALTSEHRLQVAYTDVQRSQTNTAQGQVMDLASLTSPKYPENLLAVHYSGSLRSNFFLEGQFSARNFTFEDSGGQSTDLIQGTTLSDNQTGAFWWAPLYCAVCGNEERDNTSLVLKGSYLYSTPNMGSHNLVFGYDTFNDRRAGDNHQSGSDWHIWTTSSTIVDGEIYPIVAPGFSTYIINWPILEASSGTNFRTHSFFANDHWTYNRHLTFNLGLRYDKNAGRDGSNNLVAKDDAWSPRVGLVWDPTGSGRTTINASFGKYVAAIATGVAESASPAGVPAILAYFYDGDPVNTDEGGPLVSTPEVIQRVFDWYDAAQPQPFQATIPGLGVRVDDTIRSPHSYDTVVGVSHQLTNRAEVRADFVNRVFGNFYADRIDLTTGQATDDFGQTVDVAVLENTDVLSRQYRALNLQGAYRVGTSLTTGLSYTLSRLWGNFNGENIDSGPVATSALQYPEYRDLNWNYAEGDLAADQRHRLRAWANYDLPWGRRFFSTQLSAVQQVESGTPYGAVASVAVDPFVDNPGYAVTPGTMAYYFTSRDAFRTETMTRTDLALRLSRRLGTGRAPELFAQFQALNIFNQFAAFNISGNDINTTVLTAVDDDSLELFNPFVETPVEGVHWRKGSRFGEPTGRNAYTTPRLFRFSVGVRF
jgi:outer membrane receptor protein involved in Fe transport